MHKGRQRQTVKTRTSLSSGYDVTGQTLRWYRRSFWSRQFNPYYHANKRVVNTIEESRTGYVIMQPQWVDTLHADCNLAWNLQPPPAKHNMPQTPPALLFGCRICASTLHCSADTRWLSSNAASASMLNERCTLFEERSRLSRACSLLKVSGSKPTNLFPLSERPRRGK